MGETKLFYWPVQPMYLTFRDLVAKEKRYSIRVWNTLLLGGNTRVVTEEAKALLLVHPTYISLI